MANAFKILGLLVGIGVFFAGLYHGSNRKGFQGWIWSLAAVVALLVVFSAILLLAVPGFFGGGPR